MSQSIVKGLAHIGIMTDDAAACAQFYVENLGFRHYYRYDTGQLLLNFVECGGCIIEFVQNGSVGHAGVVDHIAFEVQGIQSLVDDLKQKGIVFESETVHTMPDLFPGGVKNIFLEGPAGERIELFEYSGT